MPPLARRYLKTAIAFGVIGILTGMHMSTAQHLGAGSMHRFYVSAHTHVMLVGFSLMGAFGVALWKLPEPRPGSFHRPALDRLAYWTITLGTLVRFVAECWIGYEDPEPVWLHQTINAFAIVQGSGLILFLVNQWPRVQGPQK
jgi:heme/copper-type cytochrome/quinol oxidase subunit 1